ncbi:hypothetical protein FHT78_000284 [Rhizobium sp. BK196]|jgi:hypothetical protein|nr:hypothetical protein [Rhizobium sp. BK196]
MKDPGVFFDIDGLDHGEKESAERGSNSIQHPIRCLSVRQLARETRVPHHWGTRADLHSLFNLGFYSCAALA